MQIKSSISLIVLSLTVGTTLYAKNPVNLSQLCKKAVSHSPKIISLQHKESASFYSTEQLYDKYKPQIGITAGGGYERYDEKYPSGRKIKYSEGVYNYGATISQAIYRPKLLKQIDSYRVRELASSLQTADQKAQLITMIMQTSIERMRLEQIVRLNRKKVQLYRNALKQISSKYSLKLSNRAELNQAKAKLQRAIAELSRTKQMIMMTDANLRLLTKIRHIPKSIFHKRFNISRVAKRYQSFQLKGLKRLISHSTSVKLSKVYVDIALSEIEARKAERYPTVDISAGYSGSHAADDTTIEKRSRVMLNVNFPIFQGGYVTDRVNEAKELYLSATQDLENTKINNEISLEKYWLQIKSGLHTYKAQLSAEKAAKVYFQSAKSAYKQGLQSLTDAYLAEADYYDARVNRINTGADILKSIVNIYYVIGKTSYKDIARFEKLYLK